jgi:hypothetical protein
MYGHSSQLGEAHEWAQHSGANHRHDLAGVERRGLLLDLREIAGLQLPSRAEQRLIGFAQDVAVHLPSAGVVALGQMTQGIGRREGKRHAGGGATDFARCLSGHLAEQATEQLAPELLEILRCQADAGGGDEFLDMPLVERNSMRLSDAIHHLDLQRNDRHRRPGLWQQFQRTVEQGIVENRLIKFRIVAAGPGSGDGGGGGDKGINLTFDLARLVIAETEARLELVEEATLGSRRLAVGLANAKRHFVGVVAEALVTQFGDRLVEAETFQEHVLIECSQVDRRRCRGKRLGNAPDLLALAVVLRTIGEGSVKGDGKNGFLIFGSDRGCLRSG